MPLTDKKRITNDRYLSKFATKSIRIPKEIEEDLNAAAPTSFFVALFPWGVFRGRLFRGGSMMPRR